jgi:hypothetical protein
MKIKGFENYEVFEDGTVSRNNKILVSYMNNALPYSVVSLYEDGKKHTKFVHRLVAQTFIPNSNNLPIVNHKDGNKLNNHVDNLEWVTSAENKKHAMDNGLVGNTSGIPKRVLKYSLDGEFIAEYPSMLEAAYQNECHYTSISKACKGKQKTCKGFIWKFSEINPN